MPQGWDPNVLGRLAGDPCAACWTDHYFTRDPLHLAENVLAQACNVDVTDVNPGFHGHKFPWRWYQATISGRYDPYDRFALAKVRCESAGVRYGYERSLEAGWGNWTRSTAFKTPGSPVQVPGAGQ